MSIENLKTFDPFADTGSQEDSKSANHIHIRIQQRNGRKTLTTVQGIPKDFDPKRILKEFKKEFSTNGTIIEDKDMGDVIQVQGDQRVKIFEFLTADLGIKKTEIKIHGF